MSLTLQWFFFAKGSMPIKQLAGRKHINTEQAAILLLVLLDVLWNVFGVCLGRQLVSPVPAGPDQVEQLPERAFVVPLHAGDPLVDWQAENNFVHYIFPYLIYRHQIITYKYN